MSTISETTTGVQQSANGHPAGAWSARAAELARWTWPFVNRVDVWGGYRPLHERGREYTNAAGEVKKLGAPTTRPAPSRRGQILLTEEILTRHYASGRLQDIVGLHTTSPDNTSRWGLGDIDRHGEGSTAPEVNQAAALGWYAKLVRLGFAPLLTESNGQGGYHLRPLFCEPVPTGRVFWFMRWLVADHWRYGLANPPETFPKQPRISGKNSYGNWCRLPGRHHTREHWPRVWNGSVWLDGAAAVDFILSLRGSPAALIPQDLELEIRIWKYLAKLPNLGEGQGRDDVAYTFFCFLVRDLELPDAEAMRWVEEWDHGNRPPKGRERLREIIENAHRYGQRAYGSGNPGRQGAGHKEAPREAEGPPAWDEPILLGSDYATPEFPTELLPDGLRPWVEAEAQATQTPPDLAACLVLPIAGAGLAGKVRVTVRDGWSEPTNLFEVVSLPPGDRKSAVFADALAPVQEAERRAQEEMEPILAEKTSEHEILETRLKALQLKAAKAADPSEADRYKHEAKQVARELAAHKVPEMPQYYCDDIPAEKLAKVLSRQAGRMLLASAEGTAFEIVKGRYADTAVFETYLKGHAGDPLRVDRISREQDNVDQPALSLALAVQPDVIQGLAEQPSLRGRGFLARFMYSVPRSTVGHRAIAPAPVPKSVSRAYRQVITQLWELPGSTDAAGRPAPHWLLFSPEADRALQAFERWLEPQLAEGEELSFLAGWASKLAGAVARVSAIFHVVSALTEGRPWQTAIRRETVESAIRLGRDYFLPHALAAFGQMGSDPRVEAARHVLRWLRSEYSEYSESAPLSLSRRDIHQGNRRRFKTAEELDPVLDLLLKHYYLRLKPASGNRGRGHRSPTYEVNPAVFSEADPRTHCTHCTHSDDTDGHGNARDGEER
jgi:hypothetical protein